MKAKVRSCKCGARYIGEICPVCQFDDKVLAHVAEMEQKAKALLKMKPSKTCVMCKGTGFSSPGRQCGCTMTQQELHERDIRDTYGKCSLCGVQFEYGDIRISVERQTLGTSQGCPEVYNMDKPKLYHEKCSPDEAVKAQAIRIWELVSENEKLQKAITEFQLQCDKYQGIVHTLLAACKDVYNDPYTTCACAEKLCATIAKVEGE